MLSASRHPSTTASPDSASEEYCTAAVPVMTPAVSARDSQDINRARISMESSGRRNAVSPDVKLSVPSTETVLQCFSATTEYAGRRLEPRAGVDSGRRTWSLTGMMGTDMPPFRIARALFSGCAPACAG